MKIGSDKLYLKHKSIIIVDKKEQSDNQVIWKLKNLYSWYSIFVNHDEKMMKVSRILVEGQMNDHINISTFKYTIQGDLDSLKKILKEDYLKRVKGTPEETLARKELSEILRIRDTVGGAIIHIAYLYGKYEIGRYLVELDPQSATIVYETPDILQNLSFFGSEKHLGPYIGENILHMVISQRQYTETTWLLNFFMEYDKKNPKEKLLQKLLSAQTKGQFFQPSINGENTLYFGEYPILFAVCANDIKLVRLILLANPNCIFIRDSHGNNCLHMCVLHNLNGMYNYLLDLAREILRYIRQLQNSEINPQYLLANNNNNNNNPMITPRSAMQTSSPEEELELTKHLNRILVDVPNLDGHTPFTLAAHLGSYEMFQTLIKHRKTHIWTYGPVVCSIVNLRGFDTPESIEGVMKETFQNNEIIPSLRNLSFVSTPSKISFEEKKSGKYLMLKPHGAIDCLCRESHLEMLEIPEVMEIIEKKWDRFGRPMFMTQAVISVIVAMLVTFIIISNSVTNTTDHANYYIKSLYVIVWIIATMRGLAHDIRHILTYNIEFWGQYGIIRGAALLNNWCVTLQYLFFTVSFILKFLDTNGNDKHRILSLELESLIKIFMALSGFASWIHLYYILMGLETTGSFVVIVSAILYNDFPQFAKLYIVLLLAYGSAYSMLLMPADSETFSHSGKVYVNSLWNLFVYTVDGQSTEVFKEELVDMNAKWLFSIIYASYNLSCILLLLNLLIAMMSTTYSNYLEKAHLILLREKYNIMVNFERSLSKSQRKILQEKYAALKSSDDDKQQQQEQGDDADYIHLNNRNSNKDNKDDDDSNKKISMPDEITVEMHEMSSDWSTLSEFSPEQLESLQEKDELTDYQKHLLDKSSVINDSISKYIVLPLENPEEDDNLGSNFPSKMISVDLSPNIIVGCEVSPSPSSSSILKEDKNPTNLSVPPASPAIQEEFKHPMLTHQPSSTSSLIDQRNGTNNPIPPNPERKRRIVKKRTPVNQW